MTTSRSPGYPSVSLREAIDLIGKLHEANRTNPTDREAAAKDMGYSGLTGSSAKLLSDLSHFGLIEKAGKGGVRVSQRGVEILYPQSPAELTRALSDAAESPGLFAALRSHFSDGVPSENALKGYLVRQGFASVAIPYVIKSFTDTWRLVQENSAFKSHGETDRSASTSNETERPASGKGESPKPDLKQDDPPANGPNRELPLMDGERVIFLDEVGPGQYLKVVASGELDASLLEAMEDFTKRRRKRLSGSSGTKEDGSGEEPN